MIELPISIKEYQTILDSLPKDSELFKKLWCYKLNYLNKEKKDGLS